MDSGKFASQRTSLSLTGTYHLHAIYLQSSGNRTIVLRFATEYRINEAILLLSSISFEFLFSSFNVLIIGSLDSTVGMATSYGLDYRGSITLRGKIFLFPTASRLALALGKGVGSFSGTKAAGA
jgi:hypothetical protein